MVSICIAYFKILSCRLCKSYGYILVLILSLRASSKLRLSAKTEHHIIIILRSKSNAGKTERKLAKVLATLSECM